MKKLYEIFMTHYAPKDSETAIKEYVVATKDRDVFEYLSHGYAYWEDILENYDGLEHEECKEQYWDILKNKGDDREVYDLYYGATQYSWKEVKLDDNIYTEQMLDSMIECGIAKEIREFIEEDN